MCWNTKIGVAREACAPAVPLPTAFPGRVALPGEPALPKLALSAPERSDQIQAAAHTDTHINAGGHVRTPAHRYTCNTGVFNANGQTYLCDFFDSLLNLSPLQTQQTLLLLNVLYHLLGLPHPLPNLFFSRMGRGGAVCVEEVCVCACARRKQLE